MLKMMTPQSLLINVPLMQLHRQHSCMHTSSWMVDAATGPHIG